jgi:Rib/alpha/Esp surface antigen-like repeat protein
VFRFTMGAGNLVLNLSPGSRGPNLDINAGLYDAGGNLLASANPADSLSAGFSLSGLPAGTYFLLVDGGGKGDPTTGYSDYASLGEYLITGTAPASSSGMPPVAVATATAVSGDAPLLVSFSSSGSHDPDGGALTYAWDFGDGSAPASTANPSHTYAAGDYTARLTVTDPSGSTDQATVNITVNPPVAVPALHVDNIAMGTSVSKRSGVRATATVTVRDGNGVAVSGALVKGTWSGAASGSASGTTTSKGTVRFNSAYNRAGGTFTFTVNGITLTGYTYDADQNKETSDSITR